MNDRFLSFGGGVQTVALLLMHEKLNVDEVIFADTGNEWPQTYEYMKKHCLPYALSMGLKFTILQTPVKIGDKEVLSLEEYCRARKMTPSRYNRWCTERFKVDRIKKYVRAQGYSKKSKALIGISFDEIGRMHRSHSRAYEFEYPLIDRCMTREDCRAVILDYGWPIPHKSACWFCPYQKLEAFKELHDKFPDKFQRARQMEEAQASYPKYVLSNRGIPLKKLATRWGDGSLKLDLFTEEESCEEGYCMV